MAQKILRLNQVKDRVGLSRSTIYAAMKGGSFPSSVQLGPRAIGWLESDVDDWLDKAVSSSQPKAAVAA